MYTNRTYKIGIVFITIISAVLLLITSCYKEVQVTYEDIPDWTDESHGILSNPDYDRIFPSGDVNRIDIIIDESYWVIMLEDMTSKLGQFGQGEESGKSFPGGPGGPGGSGGPGLESGEDPVYVPCSILFEGKEWYKVGIRFKGNSSLNSVWRMGIYKLPFKLNFDEYENDYPQIKDQRFYGFRQLSLKNGFKDASLIREKVVGDLLKDAGFAAARTAFYRVYVDNGDGPKYFGFYTLVEDVDDTGINEYFSETGGNLYKPQLDGATFSSGSFNRDDFIKHSNEELSDWSDIINLYDVLHSNTRSTNNANWKQTLEGVLNVDVFLNWLAINTTIQNWDTYGVMNHNYYLYNKPSDNLLTWIPWDNNEALLDNTMGNAPLSFSFEEINDDWPLIRFLYDELEYKNKYDNYIRDFLNELFIPIRMKVKYQEAYMLIKDFVVGPDGELEGYTMLNNDDEFTSEIQYLKDHVESRNIDAREYLNN